jgi:3-phosphoinositide dependent protein kinase-1
MSIKPSIDNYEFVKRLGQGAFAEVYLMREKSDQHLYAVKKVSKSLLKREGKIEQAIRERELLSSLDHQGIVKLYRAFHDTSYLYLVMEYCPKESLSHLLKLHGRTFPYNLVKYYAAELVIILEVLRKSNIVHRDIKPENILITKNNHLKLVDFNCAKKLTSRKTMRNTFVGTLSYVAPEVIRESKQIGPEVDLWSLGCIIYQMLSGKPPFNAPSQEEIYENILQGTYILNPDIGPEATLLISGLLVTEPEGRIGCNSIDELKNHAFFQGINFENLWGNEVPDVIEEIKQEELAKINDDDKIFTEINNFNKNFESFNRNTTEIKILMDGNVQMKKKKFWNQIRRLVVTSEPSIKFYSIKTREVRGVVDISKIQNIEVSKSNIFCIKCIKKNYKFTTESADEWVGCIKKLLSK